MAAGLSCLGGNGCLQSARGTDGDSDPGAQAHGDGEGIEPRVIQRLLADLRVQDSWFYACFALWLATALRNSELIGLRLNAVRWVNRELVISRTLRRVRNSNHRGSGDPPRLVKVGWCRCIRNWLRCCVSTRR